MHLPTRRALGALALVLCAGSAGASVVFVSTASQLTAALANATAGQTIQLADGTYTGNFVATAAGTAAAPIRLVGSANAVLQSSSGYGMYLNNAQYWDLNGFTVAGGLKGIVLDGANNNLLENLTVHDIDQEGVHFRKFSSNNTIQFSHVYDTGNGPGASDSGFGEGIYIGSAISNWASLTGGLADTSNFNNVISNLIGVNVRAEGVDIKEGTTGGKILNNVFDGSGISGANSADSVVDVKGSGYLLSGNSVQNLAHTGLLADGFQVHAVSGVANAGTDNTFYGNSFALDKGLGVNIQSGRTGNVVCTNNIVSGGATGVANVALTSCAQPIDEPGSVALLGLGCLGLGAVRRLRARHRG